MFKKKINYNLFIHVCMFVKQLSLFNDDININIYFGHHKKLLNSTILDVDNVNSGYTQLYPCKYIFIWRTEELIKVLIHELIHYTNIDVVQSIGILNSFMRTHFNIKGNDSPLESYVEFLAIILNCVFVHSYINIECTHTTQL